MADIADIEVVQRRFQKPSTGFHTLVCGRNSSGRKVPAALVEQLLNMLNTEADAKSRQQASVDRTPKGSRTVLGRSWWGYEGY